MFWHLYKYKLKVLFMDKNQLFWCGIFPFILGTFFVMAFSNITETTENMQTMNIFVVADEGSQNSAEELLGAYPAFETFLDTMEEMEYTLEKVKSAVARFRKLGSFR